jgi:hypothetical protein
MIALSYGIRKGARMVLWGIESALAWLLFLTALSEIALAELFTNISSIR